MQLSAMAVPGRALEQKVCKHMHANAPAICNGNQCLFCFFIAACSIKARHGVLFIAQSYMVLFFHGDPRDFCSPCLVVVAVVVVVVVVVQLSEQQHP